jgi:hypothetical protein
VLTGPLARPRAPEPIAGGQPACPLAAIAARDSILTISPFVSGDVYEGEFREGKRHGVGMYRYSNGDVYEGQWMKGKKHGEVHAGGREGEREVYMQSRLLKRTVDIARAQTALYLAARFCCYVKLMSC